MSGVVGRVRIVYQGGFAGVCRGKHCLFEDDQIMKVDATQTCKKCLQVKLLTDFARDSRLRAGVNSTCRVCARNSRAKPPVRKPRTPEQKERRRLLKAAQNSERMRLMDSLPEAERIAVREEQRRVEAERKARREKPMAEYAREYRAANKDRVKAEKRARGKWITQATPAWADRRAMDDFRAIALMFRMYTGQCYHVDHIVPLKGKDGTELIVCGLNWEENLTVLPEVDNWRKSNQSWPDMP